MVVLILFIAAFILFVLAAFRVSSPRIAIGWAGAACIALALILQR